MQRQGETSESVPAGKQANLKLFENLHQRMFGPVDGLLLVWFRISYGLTLLYWSLHYLCSNVFEQYYVLPRYHFTYDGFGWVQCLPPGAMTGLFVGIAILAVLVTLGVYYRFTSLLLGLAFCYVFLVDKAYYQNHYYLLSIIGLTMPWLPCNASWSIDTFMKPSMNRPVVPAYTLFVVRFLVGIPYLYGGIAKINSDWLAGQPMRMVLAEQRWHPIIGTWVTQEWFVQAFVWGGMLFDLLIIPALVWKKTRLIGFLSMLVFHLMNASLFQIGVFPWFMIAATFVFLPPDAVRRAIRIRSVPSTAAESPAPPVQKSAFALLMVFVSFHLIWPLRHHVLPGDVNWNEYGHYFSWRMKLRGKSSALRFEAYDPVSGAEEIVQPQRWLTAFQVNRMARDPRMVHHFARFLKEQYADQGYPDTQIRAVVLVSLNGRKPQLLIDPTVDLGSVPREWGEPAFVVPLTEPLRHDAWDEPRTTWARHLPVSSNPASPDEQQSDGVLRDD